MPYAPSGTYPQGGWGSILEDTGYLVNDIQNIDDGSNANYNPSYQPWQFSYPYGYAYGNPSGNPIGSVQPSLFDTNYGGNSLLAIGALLIIGFLIYKAVT